MSLPPENRPRSRHGTQHSFQDTKRETPKRARPQAVTTRVSRLTEISAKKKWKKAVSAVMALRALCAVQAEGASRPFIQKDPALKARLGDAAVFPYNEDADTNQRLQEQKEKEDNTACKLSLEICIRLPYRKQLSLRFSECGTYNCLLDLPCHLKDPHSLAIKPHVSFY